ncbi:hypothetical protein V8C35DRAFT_284047 [Trichoderma chlorosporum]
MTVQPASTKPANVPVMDFKAIRASTGEERKKYLRQLDEAWSHHGAIYVINHSIGTEVIDEAFAWCKKFFDLPRAVKESVHLPAEGSKHFQGWTGVGDAISSQGVWDPEEIERLRKESATELKEAMELRDPTGTWPEGAPDLALVEEHLPGYIDFVKKWWRVCYQQSLENMQLVCEILGIEDVDHIGKTFEPRYMSTHSTWNYFLGQPAEALTSGSANRLNAHTDYGQFTMLFQDMVGGLELLDSEENIYRPVPPIKGAMIVQVGDLLEKQTNGRWRSALHRVTAPSRYMYGGEVSEGELVQRYSLVFFGYLNLDSMIELLPGCEKPGKWSTFEWKDKVTAGQWMARRVALEYERNAM